MKKLCVLIALCGMVVFAVPSFAAAPNYFQAKLGMYLPQSDDMDGMDDSFYGELAFGHYMTSNVALEIGLGYTKSSGDESDGINTISADMTIVPVTVGVKVALPQGNVDPYLIAGLGLYYCKLEGSVNFPGVLVGSASENDTVLGGFLGLGVNFNVSSNMYLGFEGKYFIAEPSFNGVDIDVSGLVAAANIGFRF